MPKLAKYIYDQGDGLVVRIRRHDVKLSAWFPYGPESLAAATALRDRFLERHGKFAVVRARSNTGITGISEVTKWFHSRPYDCFQVTCRNPRRGGMKRFFYRGAADRARALRAAVAHRARTIGRPIASLLPAGGLDV